MSMAVVSSSPTPRALSGVLERGGLSSTLESGASQIDDDMLAGIDRAFGLLFTAQDGVDAALALGLIISSEFA